MKFLEKNGLKTAQTRFRDIFQSNIHRNYADDLLAWLERETDFYHTETRRRKNPDTGFWEGYRAYAFRDPLPLGHGEKSLYLIQRHMDLEPEEALAIRWHMGAYDNAVKGDGRALSAAMEATPWVWRLHQADMCAAWVDEREAAEE